MDVAMTEIFTLHAETKALLAEFATHKDYEDKLNLIQVHKAKVTLYFKASCALHAFLHNQSANNEQLKTTLRRFALNLNSDAKKIIGFYLTYGHGCEYKQHLKFQIDLAEAHALLKHRLEVEEKHLLPEFKSLQHPQ